MQLNTNLVKVLTDLAAAAENGGINVDININVNVAASASEASSSQSESTSSESLVPDGGVEPMIGPYKSKEELDGLLNGDKGEGEQSAETNSEDAAAVPGAEEKEKVETVSEPKASQTSRPRPRPMRPGAPAAGSNGRCIKMVLQRQKQLQAMGRDVPDHLMSAPENEAEAQKMLSDLRPYLAS